ncbi:MAG: hypothetical protein Q9213_004555 [Squamulea squamosa]
MKGSSTSTLDMVLVGQGSHNYHVVFSNLGLTSLIGAILLATTSAAPVEDALSLKKYPAVPKLVGHPVVVGAGTYPPANKLSDGTILAADPAFEGGNNIIRIIISTDNGQSCEPTSDFDPVNGIWEPFQRNAHDRSLQLYYSRENAFNDQETLEHFSTDGGATWSAAQTISGVGLVSRDGMFGVVTISGNTLIAFLKTSIVGTFNISAITSTDDGKTWGTRRIIYTPVQPNTSAGATRIVNVSGTLFMTDEDDTLSALRLGIMRKRRP